MNNNHDTDRKGFTLIEILLVVLFVAVLGTVAVSTYMNSTKNFTFLSGFKNVMSVVRTARSYAITNNDIGGVKPPRYGVYLNSDCVLLFADWGDDAFNLELEADVVPSDCFPITTPDSAPHDEIVKQFSLVSSSFELQVLEPLGSHAKFDLPMQIFYDITSGKVTIIKNDDSVLDKRTNKYVVLRFLDVGRAIQKDIVLFQVSGLPEELNELP